MNNNKKILVFFLIIVLIIILGGFIYKNLIKNSKAGNNKNSQEIVDYILNLNSYKSSISVEINSNKNKNKYVLNQEYNKVDGCIQEVIEPANIAGVKIIKKGENLVIENTVLDLKTIFENYQGLENNGLDLHAFIEEYKNNDKSDFEEDDAQIIMRTKNTNQNKYIENKILYINKENNKPTKLIIQDNNKKDKILIQYKEIELN